MEATWTTTNGIQHQGVISAEADLPAGAEVPIWVDADGELMAPPQTQGDAIMAAIAPTAWRLVVTLLVVLGAYQGAVRLLDRGRRARLERERKRMEATLLEEDHWPT